MTTAKPAKKAAARVVRRSDLITFTDNDGTLEATWPQTTIRFMFSDGRTVDVRTAHDNSDLRGALLKHCKAEQIVGSTTLMRTATGRDLTDPDIHALADEAERGYDVSNLTPRETPS